MNPPIAPDVAGPVLLHGADVCDGSGAAPRRASVLVRDGRIADVDAPDEVPGAARIELGGLVLAPGFIDLHSHSDVALLLDGRAESALGQGVTLEVVGNCGISCAPRGSGGAISLGPALPAGLGIDSFADYLRALEQARPAIHVAALVGHGALRSRVLPDLARPADAAGRRALAGALEQALDEGAAGLSSGLEYLPGQHADEDELAALCACVARRGALYTTHVRNRDLDYERGLGEALRTARRAGARLQVSHMTPKFGAPPGAAAHMAQMLREARAQDLDAAFDLIPHEWGPTAVASVLPAWVFEPDAAGRALAQRLRDPALRARIAARPQPIWRLVIEGRWDDIVLFGCPTRPEVQGLSVAALARRQGQAPMDAVLDLLAEAEADARLWSLNWVGRNFAADDTACLLQEPHAGVISDAITAGRDGPLAALRWSPSTWGWAVRFLQASVQGTVPLALPEAVRRLTALPAERLGLADRGRVVPGACADLVAFDPAALADRSSLADPQQPPRGVRHVWVDGRVAVRDGVPTGARHGRVLRFGGGPRP